MNTVEKEVALALSVSMLGSGSSSKTLGLGSSCLSHASVCG